MVRNCLIDFTADEAKWHIVHVSEEQIPEASEIHRDLRSVEDYAPQKHCWTSNLLNMNPFQIVVFARQEVASIKDFHVCVGFNIDFAEERKSMSYRAC